MVKCYYSREYHSQIILGVPTLKVPSTIQANRPSPRPPTTSGETALALGKMGAVLSAYSRAVTHAPLLTKSLTCTVGFSLGDTLSQALTSTKDFDFGRTMRMASFGTLIAGPLGHFWFNFLDAAIGRTAPQAAGTIFKKILLDQLVMTPVQTVIFFAFMRSAEARRVDTDEILKDVKAKLPKTLLAGYSLWPLAHVVNFRFVPSQMRLLYINAVMIGWTAVLSTLQQASAVEAPKTQKERETKAKTT